jgi:hypothetical protein
MLWPPAIPFDAIYAGAVLHHFGTQRLEDEVTGTWKSVFYPDGVVTAAHTSARREARSTPDTFDMLMALPYIMVPRNELQATLRESEAKAEAAEQRRVHDKVDTWMKQITPDLDPE